MRRFWIPGLLALLAILGLLYWIHWSADGSPRQDTHAGRMPEATDPQLGSYLKAPSAPLGNLVCATIDTEGRPIGKVLLIWSSASSPQREALTAEGTGRATLQGQAPFSVVAVKRGFAPASCRVTRIGDAIRIVMTPTIGVTVRVVHADGRPAAGYSVFSSPSTLLPENHLRTGLLVHDEAAGLRTDHAGECTLGRRYWDGSESIFAAQGSYWGVLSLTEVRAGNPIVVREARPLRVTARGSDGKALAKFECVMEVGNAPLRTLIGADGVAMLPGVSGNGVVLTVRAEGHSSVRRPILSCVTTVDVELASLSAVTVHVVDGEMGVPVSGASIRAYSIMDRPGREVTVGAITGSDGRAELELQAMCDRVPQSFRFYVEASQYATASHYWTANSSSEVTIPLVRARRLDIQVRDAADQAISGEVFVVERPPYPGSPGVFSARNVIQNPLHGNTNGQLVAWVQQGRDIEVVAHAPSGGWAAVMVAGGTEPAQVEIVINPPKRRQLRVLGADGRGLPAATVSVAVADLTTSGLVGMEYSRREVVTTDRDGLAQLKDPVGGRLHFRVRAAGHFPYHGVLEPTQASLDIRMTPTAAISGRVTGASGPLLRGNVVARLRHGSDQPLPSGAPGGARGQVVSSIGEGGGFTVPGLIPGASYELSLAELGTIGQAPKILATAPSESAVLDIPDMDLVSVAFSLSGPFVERAMVPVTLHAYGHDRAGQGLMIGRDILLQGTKQVWVLFPRGPVHIVASTFADWPIVISQSIREEDAFTLHFHDGRATIRVEDRENRPVAGAEVTLYGIPAIQVNGTGAGVPGVWRGTATGRTDAHGEVLLAAPPEPTLVRIQVDSRQAGSSTAEQVVGPGQVIQVRLEGDRTLPESDK